ncbi:hypothetical protein V8E55_005912 [Tylopilus felleus]
MVLYLSQTRGMWFSVATLVACNPFAYSYSIRVSPLHCFDHSCGLHRLPCLDPPWITISSNFKPSTYAGQTFLLVYSIAHCNLSSSQNNLFADSLRRLKGCSFGNEES